MAYVNHISPTNILIEHSEIPKGNCKSPNREDRRIFSDRLAPDAVDTIPPTCKVEEGVVIRYDVVPSTVSGSPETQMKADLSRKSWQCQVTNLKAKLSDIQKMHVGKKERKKRFLG